MLKYVGLPVRAVVGVVSLAFFETLMFIIFSCGLICKVLFQPGDVGNWWAESNYFQKCFTDHLDWISNGAE